MWGVDKGTRGMSEHRARGLRGRQGSQEVRSQGRVVRLTGLSFTLSQGARSGIMDNQDSRYAMVQSNITFPIS